MNQPTAYLVFGPESSGTRFCTNLLIATGCAGSFAHEQPFDNHLPTADESQSDIVWRRSFPHNERWPSPPILVQQVRRAGYEPHVIVLVRDTLAMVESQLAAPHVVTRGEAYRNIVAGYRLIWQYAYVFDKITVVTYANLVKYPVETMQLITGRVPNLENLVIIDADEKWYKLWAI